MPDNKPKKILIVISHSLGELDVLLPLIAGVKSKYNIEIKMIFSVNKIYRKFKTNHFYQFCAKKLEIKTIKCQLPNKFDYRNKFFQYRIVLLSLKIYFIVIDILKFPYIFYNLKWADIYMHEFSNQLSSTKYLHWGSSFLNKKILCYIHGHAVNSSSRFIQRMDFKRNVTLLNFHEHNRRALEKYGYNKQHILGYPKFFSEWKNLTNNYISSTSNRKEKAVIIFSRPIHPYYMDKSKYEKLLLNSFKVIRLKYKTIPIIIKPHPREELTEIKKILSESNQRNYFFSTEDASVVSQGAILAISFWTSAILASLANNVPSVEYYIESERFREIEPKGSAYKNLGINSVSNISELSNFIDQVKNEKYIFPEIINEISKVKNLNIFEL